MKIRSQVGMVLNLDKCIGCHTCSVTCKNVWTGREGMEYAWFNNVETKPGIGYPKNWEDQEEWQGGWVRDVNGKIRPRLGNMPQIRVIVDEELESVWTGKKTPQQALDTAVERGNQLLRRFEKSTKS
nr:glycerol-3-phosphate ABC transporter periplasmic glycerol-3-phosphate-binding protein [uncultured bacterium]